MLPSLCREMAAITHVSRFWRPPESVRTVRPGGRRRVITSGASLGGPGALPLPGVRAVRPVQSRYNGGLCRRMRHPKSVGID